MRRNLESDSSPQGNPSRLSLFGKRFNGRSAARARRRDRAVAVSGYVQRKPPADLGRSTLTSAAASGRLSSTKESDLGAIARAIRRPKSTVSRELSRNRALRTFVLDRLAEGWTPEQIAGWLKAGNERRLRAVGCETIYAFIYRAAQKAEQLWR